MSRNTGIATAFLALGMVWAGLPLKAQEQRYDTGMLGLFAPGRWQRVQLTVHPDKTGELILDPNRGQWNGYSSSWISTKMAARIVKVRLVPVRSSAPSRPQPKAEQDTSLFDLQPEANGQDAIGQNPWRVKLSDTPFSPARLLIVEGGRVAQVIPLQYQPETPVKPDSTATDLISYRTGYLGGKLERTSYISLAGSISSGTVQVTMDGNATVLDAAGNPTASTLMYPVPKEAKLVEKTNIEAEVSAVSRVFALDGAPRPMTLVLPKSLAGTARLVLNDEQGRGLGFQILERDYRSAQPLTGTTWSLEKITYSDGKIITPEKRGRYSLQFFPDGRVMGRTNINRIINSYVAAGNKIQFGATASTRAAALNPTVETDFLKALAQVDSFKIQGNELWLMLKADSGTMVLKRDSK